MYMSAQFSCSVMSDSLQHHGLQHTRLPCSWSSYASSQWCHPTISSSAIPFSSWLLSFPSSGSFPINQFFASDGQSIEASASAPVLQMNIQDWFPVGLIGLISWLSKGHPRVFSSTTIRKYLWHSAFIMVQLLYVYMTSGKTTARLDGPWSAKWCLCFLSMPHTYTNM